MNKTDKRYIANQQAIQKIGTALTTLMNEIPFSDIQYSFHNSSSRSSHHPCLVSVLQPASPSSPFCQASFLPYSYPAAH